MLFKKYPPNNDMYEYNFVFSINNVNKDIGENDTMVKQPCKEYLLSRKLIKMGYDIKYVNSLSYNELQKIFSTIQKK